MANAYSATVVQQGPRNATVVLNGILDTANLSSTAAFALADLDQNDAGPTPTGFAILEAEFSVQSPLAVQLWWDATVDVPALTMTQTGEFCFHHCGGLQNSAGAGKTGVLNIATTGYSSGTVNFTVVLRLLKQGPNL